MLSYFSSNRCLQRRASDKGVSAAIACFLCIIPPLWPIYLITRRSVLPICAFIFCSLASLFIKTLCQEHLGIEMRSIEWSFFDLVFLLIGARVAISYEQKNAIKQLEKSSGSKTTPRIIIN